MYSARHTSPLLASRSLPGHPGLAVVREAEAVASDLPSEADVQADVIPATELFREHAPFVANFVRRLGVLERDIDDCVQETFVAVHRSGGYRLGPAKPRSWLAALALRVVQNSKRSEGRRRTRADEAKVAEAVSEAPGPFETAAVAESLARVQRVLDEMEESHRVVFLLHQVYGEECSAMAAALGVPLGTIYSRLDAARARFKREYGRLAKEGQR